MRYTRPGRFGARTGRRLIRLMAVLAVFSMFSAIAVSPAAAANQGWGTLNLSSVRAFVRSLVADAVGLPRQQSGSAAGRGGDASVAATRSGRGTGHAPGAGVGELPAFSPRGKIVKSGLSGVVHTGFDVKSSRRNEAKSTAFTDYFDNADGSYTVRSSTTPVNYKAADGTWHPIDATLSLGSDGRWHNGANSFSVSFAGGSRLSVLANSQRMMGDVVASPNSTAATASQLGEVAQMSIAAGESVAWSLSGANAVTATTSADGRTVSYPGVFTDTTLNETSESFGVAESLVLSSASAPNSWAFPLALTGVSLSQDANGVWDLVDGSGAVVAVLGSPQATDSNIDPHTGLGVSASGLAYTLSTVNGVQQLAVTLDPVWLDDPARVFPVTVDPTVSIAGEKESTYVNAQYTNQNYLNYGSEWQYLKIGNDGAGDVDRSFLMYPTGVADTGYHVSAAQFAIFDQHAWNTSSGYGYNVDVSGGSWSPSTVTWNNAPTSIWGVGGTWNGSPSSYSTMCNSVSGRWEYTPLSTSLMNQVTVSSVYYGFELVASSESDSNYWKIFDSSQIGSCSPYLSLTYTANVTPQVNTTSPVSGASLSTLTPTLTAGGSDPDNWPGGLYYEFQVLDGANGKVLADSKATCGNGTGSGTASSYTVPSGVLKWGQSYTWAVAVCDGFAWSPWTTSGLITAVPPPVLTSSLSQDSSGHGFDPSIGNYTTSVTDAQVASVGPALSLTRFYNSLDPRVTGAFGAGWSSLLDARASEQYDASGKVLSVTVTYPDGSQAGYGKNTDGTFAPPLGRFATFIPASGGGYTLTDKNDTVYTFAQALGSGVFGISSIADALGRKLVVAWSSGQITTMTSASGRALHVNWSTPSGASSPHVSRVSTNPVSGTDQTTDLAWTYSYTGDELVEACNPLQSCTGSSTEPATRYTYSAGTQYRNAVLDGGPKAYWTLGDSSCTSTVTDSVLANESSLNGQPTNLTCAVTGGPLAGSTSTVSSFNGTSSAVTLPQNLVNANAYISLALWFKTTSDGILFATGHDAVGTTSPASGAMPVLYVGTDGKLYGHLWNGNVTGIASSGTVNNGAWHHVVLSGSVSTQSLYLDGALVGSESGTLANIDPDDFLGTGVLNSNNWTATPTRSGNMWWYFNGQMSDVSLYDSGLAGVTASNLHKVGTQTTAELSGITKPIGAVQAQVQYSSLTGRVAQVTDNNGGSWQVAAPTVSGSAEGYRSAVMGGAPTGYWRLGDAGGSSAAFDEVSTDGTSALYNNVTLGVAGPLNSSQTAASFNGSASYLGLPTTTPVGASTVSVSMWFKTTAVNGVLFSHSAAALSSGSTTANYQPMLYIGADGKLVAGVGTAGVIETAAGKNDGSWHHALLSVSGSATKLYVDGVLAGSGTASPDSTAEPNVYVGSGFVGGAWPDEAHSGSSTALPEYFNGSIAEVAVFPSALDGAAVSQIYNAGKNASGLNPTETVAVTDPGTKTLTYEYDPVMGGRPIAQIDGTGAKSTFGYDASGFLYTVVDADGNETITGRDVRGNIVSRTTCQLQATNQCSTSYYTYYPDDTTALLTLPDARNDVQVTASDARSASATDTTYRTTDAYDAKGDLTAVTTPPVSGYAQGRTATTGYTDGTTAYPASDNSTVAVPAGLPWAQTSAAGAVTSIRYYADGDEYSTTNPAGLLTCFAYDGLGRTTSKTVSFTSGSTCASPSASAQTTTYTYDGAGQQSTVTDPVVTDQVTGAVHTAKTTFAHDADGDVTQTEVDDTTGGDAPRITQLSYNSLDQVRSSTDANNAQTTYTYDVYGEKVSEKNAANDTTTYAYDADGRLTYTTLQNYTGSPSGVQSAADLVEEARTYDPAGRLASVTDAMGYATLFSYTDNGLIAQVTRCSAMSVANGVPTCTGSSFVQDVNSYDGAGHLTKRLANNNTAETDYVYDAAGRQTSQTLDPSGLDRTTTQSYTADDFVASQTTRDANGSATTDYQYTPTGAMTSRSVENYTTGNPTLWWKLNQTSGTSVADSSGHGNTANATGVTWTGSSASLPGVGGQGVAADGPAFDSASSYSISAWAYPTKATGQQTIASVCGKYQCAMHLEENSNGQWEFGTASSDSTGTVTFPAVATTTAVALNTWAHVVGVYDAHAGTYTLYVNGAKIGSTSFATPWAGSSPLTIGGTTMGGGTTTALNWNGQLSNVQVYPRALAGGDVSTLYSAGQGGAALANSTNTTTWQVDPRGLALSMADANGNTTSYAYDVAGRLVQTTQPVVNTGSFSTSSGTYTTMPVAPVTTVGYDTFGEKREVKDPDGTETTYLYDADGRQTAAILPNYQQPGTSDNALISGAETKTQYNAIGEATATWDPAGTETTYAYDQLGHRTGQTSDPTGLNETSSVAYDADGDVLKTTDPVGAIRSATYDYLGRRQTSTQVYGIGGNGGSAIPAGCSTYNNVSTQAACSTTYAYTDPAGFLSQATSQAGVATGYAYDAAGERTSVTDGAGNTTGVTYDFAGRPAKTTFPDSTYSTVTYDPAGDQTGAAQYDASGTQLRSNGATYDPNGAVLSATDGNGHTATFVYEAAERLAAQSEPVSAASGITTMFGYDAAGNKTQYLSGNSNHWYTTYNAWELPETSVEPTTGTYSSVAASSFTTSYGADGWPVEQDAPGSVQTTRTYDTAGDVLTQSGNGAEAATAARSFTYYPGGLLKTAATSNTSTTSTSNATSEGFTWDDSGALASAAPNGSGTLSAGASSFTYDADGRLATQTNTVNGTAYTARYGYDSAGRLSTLADPLTGSTLTYSYTPKSLNYNIAYGTGGDVRAFAYNSAHELASDTLTSGTGTIASISYGYDANGDMTAKTTTGFTGAASNTYQYDWANRLTSWNNGSAATNYAYDADGNRIQVGANVFTYDARDELTSDGVTSYSYTARGTRADTPADAFNQAQSDGSQSYVYDALGRVVQENGSAFQYSGTGNELSYDGYALYSRDPSGALVADLEPGLSGRVDWTDQHTDVIGYFAPSGTGLAGSAAYDPLGNVLSATGHATSLGYQSEYRNSSGRSNMAARWYDPKTGQFTAKDTVVNSPVPNSANANPFGYANDNPMTGTDPTGHMLVRDSDGTVEGFGSQVAVRDAAAINARAEAQQAKQASDIVSQYASNEFDRCGARVGCFNGRMRALQSVHVSKDGRSLTGDPAAVADLNRILGVSGGDVAQPAQSKSCSWNPMSWGGCAQNAVHWVAKHPLEALGAVVGVIGLVVACVALGPVVAAAGAELLSGTIGVATVEAATTLGTAVMGALAPGSAEAMMVGVGLSAAGGEVVAEPEMSAADQSLGADASLSSDAGAAADGIGAVAGDGTGTGGAVSGGVAEDIAAAGKSAGGAAGKGLAPAERDVAGSAPGAGTATPAERSSTPSAQDPAEPSGGSKLRDPAGCGGAPHSFTGDTGVLMADGSAKPIGEVKIGDRVANAVPGQSTTQANTVTDVIVTKTDHDFVALRIAPLASGRATAVSGPRATPAPSAARGGLPAAAGKALRAAAAALAVITASTPATAHGATSSAVLVRLASAVADTAPSPADATLTTTFHHPFYDITQAAFVDAQHLESGDELQTPTGHAQVTSVRLYHADTVTYDLTIGDLHTFYVLAGTTPVLVHNCGTTDFYTVQGPEDSARLTTKGGKPFPTEPDRAHFGPGVYSWGSRAEAEAYAANKPGAQILKFSINNDDLAGLSQAHLGGMSDDEATSFMERYSLLWDGDASHGLDYISRPTNRGTEHYFSSNVFDLLNFGG